MPEGPLGFPRFQNIGPLTRSTEKELRDVWSSCPEDVKEQQVCQEYKVSAIAALQSEGFFAECDTLEDINSGNCHNLAKRVNNELPFTTYVQIVGGDHGWIRYNGKHFDAEKPSGVSDPFDLPFFDRHPPEEVLYIQQRKAKSRNFRTPESVDEMIVEA